MKKFNSAALVLSKVLESIHWIGCVGMVVLLIVSLAAKDWLNDFLSHSVIEYGSGLSTYGFSIMAADAEGKVVPASITVFAIGGIMIMALMAMVFRNAYLIFRTAKGKTWFANGATPFQKDITRMVREIGIFYITVPVIGLIMSGIARIFIGAEVVEISVRGESIITGILIICLSQVFAYGNQLQDDVDGLL